MSSPIQPAVDTDKIHEILWERKKEIQVSLKSCAHCSLCADSCFLYQCRDKDPRYMPSHKFINSIGTLYNKKGDVTREALEEIRDIVWKRCVLCTRCYCPLGVDIPSMIALARKVCRSQNVFYDYTQETGGPRK
jgi:Fe-S oxidoreductase